MKINKYNSSIFISFFISPLFPLASLLYYNSRRNQDLILTLLISLMSYLFKPNTEMDKYRHFESFLSFKGLSFQSYLLEIFKDGFDFFFKFCFYIGSNIGLSFHAISFLITFTTIRLIITSCRSIVNENVGSKNIFYSFYIFAVVSYIDLFSGMRFMLASSFLISALAQYWRGKINLIFWLKLLLSIFTHFSLIITFIPLVLDRISRFFGDLKINKYFWLSFVSFLLPKDYVSTALISTGMSELLSLESKVDFYINEIGLDATNSTSQFIIDQSNFLWLPFLIIFILTQRKDSKIENLLIFFILTVLIFMPFQIIFFRYLILVKIISFIYLFSLKMNNYNKYLFSVILLIWLVSFLFQLVILRNSILNILLDIFTNVFTPWILVQGDYNISNCN